MGVLDNDNPLKNGYRNANRLVTLLDNHDLDRRIMSHARTKHVGTDAGLDWAIRVSKLCLGALLTSFHPQMVFLPNLSVNLRACLCGVVNYASAQALDFLDLGQKSSFLDWKHHKVPFFGNGLLWTGTNYSAYSL